MRISDWSSDVCSSDLAASITYFALVAMYLPFLLGGDSTYADRATYLPASIFSIIFTIAFIDTLVLPSVAIASGTDVVMLVRDYGVSSTSKHGETMLHSRQRLLSKVSSISWVLVTLLLVTTYCTTKLDRKSTRLNSSH